jgi:hypothetical protein
MVSPQYDRRSSIFARDSEQRWEESPNSAGQCAG